MQLYEPNCKSILGNTAVPHMDSVIRSCNIGHTVWSSGGRFERKTKQVCDEPLSDGILFNSSTSMHEFEIENHFETFYLYFFGNILLLYYATFGLLFCLLSFTERLDFSCFWFKSNDPIPRHRLLVLGDLITEVFQK